MTTTKTPSRRRQPKQQQLQLQQQENVVDKNVVSSMKSTLSSSSKKLLDEQHPTTTLIGLLIPLWDEYQQQSSYDDDTINIDINDNNNNNKMDIQHSSKIVRKIQKEITTYYKKKNDTDTINIQSQVAQEEIQQCIQHFFNCAIVQSSTTNDNNIDSDIEKENQDTAAADTIVEHDENNNESNIVIQPSSKKSIDKVLQLTAIITATRSITSLQTCLQMLHYVEHISQTTTSSSELYRSISCQWIGYLVHSLQLEQNNTKQQRRSTFNENYKVDDENSDPSNDNDINNQTISTTTGSSNVVTYNDILDTASQALIPRFTDKSQIVRMAAVTAGSNFFAVLPVSPVQVVQSDTTTSTVTTSTTTSVVTITTDPDILQSMIWSLQHDPSPNNRYIACTVLPINLETIDYIITRIRDVKVKVRCTALQRLYNTFSSSQLLSSARITNSSTTLQLQLEPSQAAACIMAGWTNRCTATKNATRKMICCGWMKAFDYNLLHLVIQLDVYENQNACEIVVEAVQEALSDGENGSNDGSDNNSNIVAMLQEDLSEVECEQFQRGMKIAYNCIVNIQNGGSVDFSSLTTEQLFLASTILKVTTDNRLKEKVLESVFADIPTLCTNLEAHETALIESIRTKDVATEDVTSFHCQQLLRLACHHQSTTMEEGSRRIFCTALKSMLSNILTPDDLIESAIDALRLFVDNDSQPFIEHIDVIVREVNRIANDNLALLLNCKLRVLSLLSFALEKIKPSDVVHREEVIQRFGTIISDSISVNQTVQGSALLQEAAILCYGKLGLLQSENVIKNEYMPTLVRVAKNCDNISVTTQSIIALCDFSMITKLIDEQVIELTSKHMMHSSVAVSCIASEVACKLLLHGLVDDTTNSIWLARLLIRFFDQSESNENDTFEYSGEFMERGNPIRLQQLLTVFFPTLCIQNQDGQDAIMGAIEPMLDIIVHGENSQYSNKQCTADGADSGKKVSKKRGRKTKAWPFAKIIEYICTQVRIGETKLAQQQQKNLSAINDVPDPSSEATVVSNDEEVESSPELIASIQIADFLSKNIDNIDTTTLRALCKILGSFDFNEETEACDHLHTLKELMEDISTILDDDTATKYLQKLNRFLEKLSFVDGNENEEEE